MERVITKYKAQRMELYETIAQRYRDLDNGVNQISAVTELISREMGVCVSTVYKARRIAGLNKKYIDRYAMMEHYDRLVAERKSNSEAVKMTARYYQCSTGYVYQLVKRFKS